MSGPPSGGRVRHASPVRQTEQLLPVTVLHSAGRDGGAPASGGAAAEPARSRRGKDGGATAAVQYARPGRPCAAAALLSAAVILVLG